MKVAPLEQRAAQEQAPVAGVRLVRPPLPLKRERRVPLLSGGAPIRVRAPSAVDLREMKRARFGDDLVIMKDTYFALHFTVGRLVVALSEDGLFEAADGAGAFARSARRRLVSVASRRSRAAVF